MSNLDALQARLEIFREAGRNLQVYPLVTEQDLARLGVQYQAELIDELEQSIEDSPSPKDNKLIFTGHTGCGKSTLLADLKFRLIATGRYFVVRYSIAETIERSAVDHVNILFSMALQLLEEAEKRSIRLQPGVKREFYQWLGKHTQTETQAVESEIEFNAEASAKGGIPLILEFLAKVKSKLKLNSVTRQEISIEFGRRTSDLVAQIDRLQSYIENATGQQILVIIDDLDKLDLSVAETIFSKNIQSLLDPNLRIIYTIPIATLREVSIKSSITSYVSKIHTMRVTKFFSKAAVRNPNRIPDRDCVDLFDRIIDRRLPIDSIDPDVKQELILLSGGVLRELIRIVDRCCSKVMVELRGQIRRQQWNQPEVKIDRRIFNDVMTDLQIERAEVLGKIDFEMLKAIYQNFQPQDTENQRFLDLLHGLYILEYRNAKLWYDLNPIVRDLLVEEGLLS
jgi:energy-coupling factor transporter ATP-binding protein EcfA2